MKKLEKFGGSWRRVAAARARPMLSSDHHSQKRREDFRTRGHRGKAGRSAACSASSLRRGFTETKSSQGSREGIKGKEWKKTLTTATGGAPGTPPGGIKAVTV